MIKSAKSKRAAAVSCLLLATMIWGTSFPILKISLQAFTPLWFLGIRFLAATLIMLVICLPRLKKLNRNMLKDGLLLGLPVALAYTTQTIGLMYTSTANNAFITATYVVIVPFLVWGSGKKIRGVNFLIAAATLAGLAVFSLSDTLTIASGDIWTIACAFLFAVHMTMLGSLSSRHDPFLLTLLQLLMVSLVNTLLAIIFEAPPTAASFTPSIIGSLAYCAVFPSIACYLIQTWVQSILSPMTTSILMMSEAIWGSLFGYLMLNEGFGTRKFIGAAILLTCIIASVILDNRAAKKTQS